MDYLKYIPTYNPRRDIDEYLLKNLVVSLASKLEYEQLQDTDYIYISQVSGFFASADIGAPFYTVDFLYSGNDAVKGTFESTVLTRLPNLGYTVHQLTGFINSYNGDGTVSRSPVNVFRIDFPIDSTVIVTTTTNSTSTTTTTLPPITTILDLDGGTF